MTLRFPLGTSSCIPTLIRQQFHKLVYNKNRQMSAKICTKPLCRGQTTSRMLRGRNVRDLPEMFHRRTIETHRQLVLDCQWRRYLLTWWLWHLTHWLTGLLCVAVLQTGHDWHQGDWRWMVEVVGHEVTLPASTDTYTHSSWVDTLEIGTMNTTSWLT